jgi:hypothetical protein
LRKNRDELVAKNSRHFVAAAKGLRAFFKQFAADQHAADFARARADLVELGVAQQPPERIVVGVTVSAQNLDGVEGDLGRAVADVLTGALACKAIAGRRCGRSYHQPLPHEFVDRAPHAGLEALESAVPAEAPQVEPLAPAPLHLQHALPNQKISGVVFPARFAIPADQIFREGIEADDKHAADRLVIQHRPGDHALRGRNRGERAKEAAFVRPREPLLPHMLFVS